MSGDSTYQGLRRISWLPEREATDNGTAIAGQNYNDVEFIGGTISNITLTDPTFSDPNAVLNDLLPTQTGNSGKVLTTDGVDTSWTADIDTGITELTGDVTAGPGSGSQAATLATVNANVGSFGSSTSIPSFTVNAKGLITAASGNAVVAPAGTLTGATLASGVTASSLTSVGTLTGGATGAGFTVALGTSTVTGALGETNGGTGASTYTTGDILYASASNTLSKLAAGSNGEVLTLDSGVPSWASGGGSPLNTGYADNRYYFGGLNTSSTNMTVTSDRLYARPFVAVSDQTFTRIGIEVTVGDATDARLGIYNCVNGVPTTLVLDAGTVDCTSTGQKEATISQALTAGSYFLVVVFEGTPDIRISTLSEFIAGTFLGTSVTNGSNTDTGVYVAHSYAVLPTPFGGVTYTGLNMPGIWLRKV